MTPSWFLLLVLLEVPPAAADAGAAVAETKDFLSPQTKFPNWLQGAKVLRRVARGSRSGSFGGKAEPRAPGGDLRGSRTSLRTGGDAPAQPANGSSEAGLFGPLSPLSGGSHWAYAVALLALLLFTAGLVGNLALMCTVWHHLHLKSTWNGVLAGLALCDFLVLFFCLPVVVVHELSVTRLLGDLSCRLVPYLEVTSLGVAAFSLCALSIDRFNAAVAAGPLPKAKVEPCGALASKLSVIWVGSMLLAAPELLLWRLLQETPPAYMRQHQLGGTLMATLGTWPERTKVDVCVREPSVELSDSLYSLVLTYHGARAWWLLGCYVCLPLLFSLACGLLTRHIWAQRPAQEDRRGTRKQLGGEPRLRSALTALGALQVACVAPESVGSIVLGYLPDSLLAWGPPALGLVGQFLLFLRCTATPLVMLVLCGPLGRALVDGCCCCCRECVPDGDSFSTSTTATSTSAWPTSPPPSGQDGLKMAFAAGAPLRRGQPERSSLALGTPC